MAQQMDLADIDPRWPQTWGQVSQSHGVSEEGFGNVDGGFSAMYVCMYVQYIRENLLGFSIRKKKLKKIKKYLLDTLESILEERRSKKSESSNRP